MDAHSKGLRLRLHSKTNETLYAYVDNSHLNGYDDVGALYYVVAVVLMYGLSIVMMIASHIRKNQQDSQLRAYLKEMAILRKNDRREKIIGVIAKTTPSTTPRKSVTVILPVDDKSAPTSTATSQLTDEDPSEPLLPSDTESVLAYDSMQMTQNKPRTPTVKIQIIDENGPVTVT